MMTEHKLTLDQLKTACQKGRVSVDDLLAIIEAERKRNGKLQRTVRRLTADVKRLTERLAQYEPEVKHEPSSEDENSSENPSDYSVEAEEDRRRKKKKKKKKSSGRKPTKLKFLQAKRIEDAYPEGVSREDCKLFRERVVWRLEEGRAVLVGYRIYRGPGNKIGRIEGVTPHCEYGIEILVVLAHLVYIIGISMNKACQVMGFFCHLPIRKSQVDALFR